MISSFEHGGASNNHHNHIMPRQRRREFLSGASSGCAAACYLARIYSASARAASMTSSADMYMYSGAPNLLPTFRRPRHSTMSQSIK